MNTWIITGASSGIGEALVNQVLNEGDFVYATFRQQEQVDKFNELHTGKGEGYLLDVTDLEGQKGMVNHVLEQSGKIDFLVNNAGYGLAGAIEETSNNQTRDLFETNFYAPLELTKLVLPNMRKRGSGHIFQISSHGGVKAFPGFGIYNASKFALEGMSEALAAEVAPLGIHVTIVEPGPFRTGFAGNSFRMASDEITDYAETAGAFRSKIKSVDGIQEGSPSRAASVIYEVSTWSHPPLRLPLGRIALKTIAAKLASVQADLDSGKLLAESAVFE